MNDLGSFLGKPIPEVTTLGWFGFSADPPTIAHREIIDVVLESKEVESIIVFPAGKLKYKSFQAEDWQRTEMVERWKAAAGFKNEVIISHFDMERTHAFTWYDLWEHLQIIAPDIQHSLIVGSDQYLSIAQDWHRGKELLQRASFLVVRREGCPAQSIYAHHRVLSHHPIQGSSTEVRAGRLEGVDHLVKAFILEHQLYLS